MQVKDRRSSSSGIGAAEHAAPRTDGAGRAYTFPTTYECFAPNHFLISSWLVKRLTFLLPRQRPMDNMMTGWDRPQEDEFALCNMGIPSPYLPCSSRTSRNPIPNTSTWKTCRPPSTASGRSAVVVSAARHAAQSEADHPQVAASLGPDQGDSGDLPQRAVRAHRPRPVRGVCFHGQVVENTLPVSIAAASELHRARGIHLHLLRAPCTGRSMPSAACSPRRGFAKCELQGSRGRLARRNAPALRPSEPGRLRSRFAASAAIPGRHQGL